MSFARKHMYKHGWTEGKGLGLHESGMTTAIKVKIKRDNAGMGHDMAEEFTFHWWDHVFNRAANKIKVKGEDDSSSSTTSSDDDYDQLQVSNKKPSKRKYDPKAILYGRFVSGGLLVDENAKRLEAAATVAENSGAELTSGATSDAAIAADDDSDSDADDSEEERKLYAAAGLPEEELFKRCGGRTAHKGARHGLKLSAKLLRIERQEAIDSKTTPIVAVESKPPSTILSIETPTTREHDDDDYVGKIKKKKKKNKDKKRKIINEGDEIIQVHSDEKKKNKKKRRLIEADGAVPGANATVPEAKKKKKRREAKNSEACDIREGSEIPDVIENRRKGEKSTQRKLKAKKKEEADERLEDASVESVTPDENVGQTVFQEVSNLSSTSEKRSKKKKRNKSVEAVSDDPLEDLREESSSEGRKKKRKKRRLDLGEHPHDSDQTRSEEKIKKKKKRKLKKD